ncbi:MAG: InlB B-repeat-containing protein [Clostridia bacterium]|nr:InlB B-repeat-containing protein [Clostridia bacterium]
MLKKLICIILCLLCVTFLIACDNADTPQDNSNNNDSKKNEYTITWKSESGTTLETTKVEEGTVPSFNYTVADTAEWDYTMNGWASSQDGEVASIPAATADATYYAKVTKVKKTYTVTFVTNGGSGAISAVTAEYGQTVSAPTANPTKADHRFAGWYTDTALQTAVTWPITVTENKTVYAAWNEQIDIPALLQSLLSGYQLNPYQAIPDSMKPGAAGNLITSSNGVVTDYTSAVNVSTIRGGGFGEQWHMVLDNLQQTNTFFNVLSVVEGLTTTSVSAFNNYFDNNPSDTAHHNFASGIYSVTIDFDGEMLFYVLDYTANIPVLGQQTVQISMSMNAETEEKTVRVQIGDANALKYTISGNSYEFYIKYLGVRRAYFAIEEVSDGVYEGHLKEFLTISGVGLESAADFYIDGNYVTAVGNKASGLLGFDNYICELYSVSTGKMLGYEVRESKSFPIVGEITFNTLWLDLNYVNGINTIRYVAAPNDDDAAFYVNGSSTPWKADKNTVSRKFDIEFRTQYFYVYDATEEAYTVVEVQVPMLFVQEENYNTLAQDIESTNDIEIVVTLSSVYLNKLLSNYDTYIDVFIENKATMTEDLIIANIGNKKTFA